MNIITWLKALENKAKTLSLLLKKSLKNGIIYIVERVLNMACNYQKFLYNDYKELLSKYTKQENLLKETKELISNLNSTINNLNKTVNELKEIIKEKDKEILRLKSKNDRDSSNSNKPSGTNGYKKVITSRREKSDKTKGGQKNHKAHSLKNKLEQFINSGNIEENIIEINKNENNKNKRYIEKVVIDIKITKHITRYRYYPDKTGKYNIPKCHNQYVQYGENVKAICIDLMNHLYNSTDGVVRFIDDITNGGITLSKGTLTNWNNEICSLLKEEINKIESSLLNSYYINHDESQIKINGDGNNVLCACNKDHVRLWIHKHKSQEALKEIGLLPKYQGIIVKDGTELYNPYGIKLSQCLSHILRYLKPFYTDIKHVAPKEMSDFLSKYNDLRTKLINDNVTSFKEEDYKKSIEEYNEILDKWEKEIKEDINNYLFEEEYKLFKRMKYDNKNMDPKYRGDKEEILYFLKDFKVPSTNNAAESAQRPTKIKQKIGKFRSMEGAKSYAVIRSCISTYKKNAVNVLDALKRAFNNQPVII